MTLPPMAVQSFKQEVKTSTSPRADGQGHFIPVLSPALLSRLVTGFSQLRNINNVEVQAPTNHPSTLLPKRVLV